MKKKIFNKYLGLLLLLGIFIIGLVTYKSYGIGWDEKLQRDLGLYTYNYLFHGKDDSSIFLSDNKGFNTSLDGIVLNMKQYGAVFELPLIVLEKVFNLHDSRDIYLMRHLVTHLFFLLGAFAFFLLIDYLYHNKLLAAIGFLLLVVNPLIYGNSFVNTKDISFLSTFIICFLIAAIAFNKNTVKWYILLGAACALLTNLRIIGILMTGSICIFFVLDYIALKQDKEAKRKTAFNLLMFTVTFWAVLYISWPYLYPNPIKNFAIVLLRMSKFPRGGALFRGVLSPKDGFPRDYAITWFCIANPIIYLGLGFLGLVYFIKKLLKTPKLFIFDKVSRNYLLFLFWFLIPLLIVIIRDSVLYNSWRHLMFIYPPFILIGLFWLEYLLRTKAKAPILLLLMASLCYTGFYMVSNFPYEYVYFNEGVRLKEYVRKYPPDYLRKNFEMEYWGTSYKQALEYLLKNDTSHTINLFVNEFPGKANSLILKPEERKRINYTDSLSQATYFAGIYIFHPQDFPFQQREVYSIKILNSRIISVFKLK